MNNFTYEAPTKIYFGRKQECNVGEYIKPFGKKVMMIHYGEPFIKTTGLYDRLMDSLKGSGLEVIELTGIVPNPKAEKIREGIELCRSENVDFLMPVGGGSVIDTAKAISAGYGYDGDFWDIFVGKGTPGKVLPIGVVLTIAATGSESNCAAVVTNDEVSAKIGYANPLLYPKFALMNPELTTTLPKKQTAAACVDIIAHVLEDYIIDQWNVELNDRFCESIMKTVVEVAPVLMKDPADYDARAELMWCSNNACKGFLACGTEIDATSHILEHELSAKYDVTHGVGLAVIQPAWLRHIYKDCIPRFAKFAVNVWGCEYNFGHPEKTALEGIERMESFFESLGMPTHLSQLGIPGDRIEEMAHNCFNRYGAITSVKEFTVDDYIEIFRLAL